MDARPVPLPRVGLGVAVPGRRQRQRPRYALNVVKARVAAGEYKLTGEVRKHLAKKSWDESDVVECIAATQQADFHKSQPHDWRPDDARVDVYKPHYEGARMYLKFTEHEDGRTILFLSFCEDHEVHH